MLRTLARQAKRSRPRKRNFIAQVRHRAKRASAPDEYSPETTGTYNGTRSNLEACLPQAIAFLKERRVLTYDPELQAMRFKYLEDPNLAASEDLSEYYRKAQRRLLHLFDPTRATSKEEVPSDVHQFTPEEFTGYDSENVFFLKHPKSQVQRLQLSGLCYMHAPAVVQHYRIADNHKVPMLDIKEFVRKNFDAAQLERHIFDNQGGDSRSFLQSIIQPDSVVVPSGVDTHADYFAKYGAGLISQFQVHENFYDTNVRKHYGPPSGKLVGLHSMALVGHRKAKDGKRNYLLQNWWKAKQFVEIDEEYLEKSGASVFFFIKTPQTEIPTNFPQVIGKYFELEAIDKPEGLCNEMMTPQIRELYSL